MEKEPIKFVDFQTKNTELTGEDIEARSQYISNKNKDMIITDMDEILVNIGPKWVYELLQQRNYFDRFMNFPIDSFDSINDLNTVLYRPEFYLNNWLERDVTQLKDNNVSQEEYKEYIAQFFSVYDTKDFYDSLSPTRLAVGLRQALNSRILKKIHIVTRVTGKNVDSKLNFIRQLFDGQMSKVQIWEVGEKEKKSDAVNAIDNLDRVAALYEDENKNIIDILENSKKLQPIEIFSPRFIYNNANEELISSVERHGSTLSRYEYSPNTLY